MISAPNLRDLRKKEHKEIFPADLADLADLAQIFLLPLALAESNKTNMTFRSLSLVIC